MDIINRCQIGIGNSFQLNRDLSKGKHTITLRATDKDGNFGEKSIEIEAFDWILDYSPAYYIDFYDPPEANEYLDIAIDNSVFQENFNGNYTPNFSLTKGKHILNFLCKDGGPNAYCDFRIFIFEEDWGGGITGLD